MKNLGHPTAEQLVARRAEWLELPEHIERRNEYGKEVRGEEFNRDQYLWTMYRYEIDNSLTTLNYDEWVFQTLQRNCQLRSFVHRTGMLESDRKNVIEFLCSKRLALGIYADNLEYQVIEPYGDESASEGIDYSKEIKSEGSNIVLLGNQNVNTAIRTFNAISDREVSLTYAFVCSKENFTKMKRTMSTIYSSVLPAESSYLIEGIDFFEKSDGVTTYIKKITKSDKRHRLF